MYVQVSNKLLLHQCIKPTQLISACYKLITILAATVPDQDGRSFASQVLLELSLWSLGITRTALLHAQLGSLNSGNWQPRFSYRTQIN